MTQLSLFQREWIQSAVPIVVQAMHGRDFSADDLHVILEKPENDNWFGVLIAKMKCQGLIQRIGYGPSARPERNGGIVARWRVNEKAEPHGSERKHGN